MNKVSNEYIEKDGYAEIHLIGSKYMDKIILVDIEDIEKLKKRIWTVNKYNKCDRVYFYGVSNKGELLHRFIMDATDGRNNTVDHINEDTLDNRKDNLHICTHKENLRKQRPCRKNKSGAKGVIWCPYKGMNKWMAYINVNYKHITLGYFKELEDAIKSRKEAEEIYFKE